MKRFTSVAIALAVFAFSSQLAMAYDSDQTQAMSLAQSGDTFALASWVASHRDLISQDQPFGADLLLTAYKHPNHFESGSSDYSDFIVRTIVSAGLVVNPSIIGRVAALSSVHSDSSATLAWLNESTTGAEVAKIEKVSEDPKASEKPGADEVSNAYSTAMQNAVSFHSSDGWSMEEQARRAKNSYPFQPWPSLEAQMKMIPPGMSPYPYDHYNSGYEPYSGARPMYNPNWMMNLAQQAYVTTTPAMDRSAKSIDDSVQSSTDSQLADTAPTYSLGARDFNFDYSSSVNSVPRSAESTR